MQNNVLSLRTKEVINTVVVCTDLSGFELHRQVGVGIMLTSGMPRWSNASTLARNARFVGSIPILGIIFPIFITPMTLVSRD